MLSRYSPFWQARRRDRAVGPESVLNPSAPPIRRLALAPHDATRNTPLTPLTNSGRFKWDLLTTVPWEGVVIATARIDCASRAADYVMLLGLLKLGRMYRLFVMFRFFTYNLALSLVAITLLRNLAYVIYLLHW